MCIAIWIWQTHPRYPLLLLSNRDEYYNRDEVAGGTWLGCTSSGRLAFLTNFMEPNPSPFAKSRGELPIRFLQSHMGPLEFAEGVAKEAAEYNGFNLVLADLCSKVMVYVSNRPLGVPVLVQIVSPGLHVLSNAKLDTPWPKLSMGIIAAMGSAANDTFHCERLSWLPQKSGILGSGEG